MKYLRWLADAIRPYWVAVTVMMICHVLIACCSIGFVYVSKMLVDVAVAYQEDCRPVQDFGSGPLR